MPNKISKEAVDRAAVSMGYRRSAPDKDSWCKPVGYSMLSICWYANSVLWDQWFYSADDDKLVLWCSKDLSSNEEEHGTLTAQIKSHETWEYKSMSVGRNDSFEFLTKAEAIHFALEGNDGE